MRTILDRRYAGLVCMALCAVVSASAAESVWIEAEHLHGIRGACFPDLDQKTAGHWALSGPGIAPEWTQGGESEWLSIACAPDDDKAGATTEFEVPERGEYRLWVRYRDWREQTELFRVRIEQAGKPQEFTFGEKPVVDENDELKLLWKWAFGWDARTVKLEKGPAKLALLAGTKQPGHRQVDALCLTTDAGYRPFHREKPSHPNGKLLDGLRTRRVAEKPLAARSGDFTTPAGWKVGTFRDQGFVYLWNVSAPWLTDLASQDPKRVLFPYHTEPVLTNAFREAFGGRGDLPIFSDPRIVPAFHSAGPNILSNAAVVAWLEANPNRAWANMMNYANPVAMADAAKANWPKFRARYVGNISGENLGYFDYDHKALAARIQAANSREEVWQAMTDVFMTGNAEKQKAIFGAPVEQHYFHTIPCQSAEMMTFAHACREWGARTVGYENTAVAPSLAMRLAFLRGSARQYGGLWAVDRSSNFGDAATIYSEQQMYPGRRYVYDNSYDVWAGAGMTWYKFDIWHQYLSGASLFYHEQGFDEFWTPGGGVTPPKPIQLSRKGRLVDQFLKLTAKHPDRGTPFTPIAFLLDRAHGWDPTAIQPSYFGHDPSTNPSVLTLDRHARMLKEWFKVAYHPYGPKEAEINTGVNQIYIPGVLGDIFDVLVTSPTKLDAVGDYPVVVLNGELTLSEAWGRKLAGYLDEGGTLIVSAEQLSGPGVAALKLPKPGNVAESDKMLWLPTNEEIAAQRFRYQALADGEPLARAGNGDVIAARIERGKGTLVFLSVPLGLGLDRSAIPLVALVLAHARQGLLPLEVEGDVEWLLNRTDKGWIVTLLNPAGSNKPQHGLVVTDYAQERTVRIRSATAWRKASEWFTEAALPLARDKGESVVDIAVPAGGVRIVELES